MIRQIKQKRLLVTLLVFTMTGCATKITTFHSCKEEVPTAVISNFEMSFESRFNVKAGDTSISAGMHSELYSPQYGYLGSRKYGWKLNVKYIPFLVYESKDLCLIKTGSQYDRIRLTKDYVVTWYLIRKKDGKVLEKMINNREFFKEMILKDVYYFRLSKEDPTIYCFELTE